MSVELGSYPFWKLIHIVGVVIFLGNITVTAVWKTLANATKEPKVIAYAQRLVTITDIWFTFGGVVLILISGYNMAEQFGGITGTVWLKKALTLFIASAVIWLVILIPVQIMQSKMAKSFQNDTMIPERYWKLSKVWALAGTITVILPFIILYLMVAK
ncbi:MAG: DUF2269 family protein [Robiginitomaculum sp.]